MTIKVRGLTADRQYAMTLGLNKLTVLNELSL